VVLFLFLFLFFPASSPLSRANQLSPVVLGAEGSSGNRCGGH
jgi:hypothetical protein